MHIRSLQSRIVALFLLLMIVVQVGGLLLISTLGMSAARKTIGENLVAGALVFDSVLKQDIHRLVQGVDLMSSDYTLRAVRGAIITGDRSAITSMLATYGKRLDASLMMIVSLDQRVLGDTLGAAPGTSFEFPKLMTEAEASGQASASSTSSS